MRTKKNSIAAAETIAETQNAKVVKTAKADAMIAIVKKADVTIVKKRTKMKFQKDVVVGDAARKK